MLSRPETCLDKQSITPCLPSSCSLSFQSYTNWNRRAVGIKGLKAQTLAFSLNETDRLGPRLVPPWLSVWLWTNHLATLCLIFLIYYLFHKAIVRTEFNGICTQKVTKEWLWKWLVRIWILLPSTVRDVMPVMEKRESNVEKTTYRVEHYYSDFFLYSQPVQLRT